jgi:hypothetical protein
LVGVKPWINHDDVRRLDRCFCLPDHWEISLRNE